MRILLTFLLLATLAAGCMHTKVTRTGRIERVIRVEALLSSPSEADLVITLLRKAQDRKCAEIKIVEIEEGVNAIGHCYDVIQMMPLRKDD
jgi:hypothetical protein